MEETIKRSEPTLSDFVASTILEIADGLHNAQAAGREKGLKIYPDSYEDTSEAMDIEFDLSVNSEMQGNTDGNVKINVSVFGFGYSKGSEGKTGTMNRLLFTVPVNYVVFNKGQRKYTEEDLDRMPRMRL